MRRNSINFVLVLGAKQQLSQLLPMIKELSDNWGDSEVVDLTPQHRTSGEGDIRDFSFTLHCIKNGEVHLIANVQYLAFTKKGLIHEKNLTLVRYENLAQVLEHIADFDKTAEFWGDTLYNELYCDW